MPRPMISRVYCHPRGVVTLAYNTNYADQILLNLTLYLGTFLHTGAMFLEPFKMGLAQVPILTF